MTIYLTPEQERRLTTLAEAARCTPDAVVRHFLQWWLGPKEDLAAAVREGEESAEREGWLTHDEVFERLIGRLV